ncbi:MAG: TIGR00266 family protein [Synechococcus sp.]|nr:TIGR00266 family protein [Synechococcus sp.]
MKYEIRYKPAFACLFVTLEPGERLTAESGAMVSMDGGITMKAEFSGGFVNALLRRFFGGESLFVNVYQNTSNRPQTVILTQSMVGDIHRIDLSEGPICFQPGAYIAHTPGAKMGVHWAGFASWFAGEGLFKLQFTGTGRVFYGCYGGIMEKHINGEFIVDNSHLVAYDPGISMNIRMSGGVLGSLTSGEGLVNKLKGRGRIYLQSRSVSGLVGFLRPKCR